MTSKKASSVRNSSAGWMMYVLGREMRHSMEEALGSLNVSLEQFSIIMTLLEFDGLSQAAIGRKVNIPSYAMTRLLDVLEDLELVTRKPDHTSRRSFRIELTRKGRVLAPKLFETVEAVNAEVLMPLSLSEKKQLLDLMGKIIPASYKSDNERDVD